MQWTASEMGKKGGSLSKRTLSSETAKKMVLERERKRALLKTSNDSNHPKNKDI